MLKGCVMPPDLMWWEIHRKEPATFLKRGRPVTATFICLVEATSPDAAISTYIARFKFSDYAAYLAKHFPDIEAKPARTRA